MQNDKPQERTTPVRILRSQYPLGLCSETFDSVRYPEVKKVATGYGQSQKHRVIITVVQSDKSR
jgi:hypothetical protein